jgi:2,3-dihydroxybenzoate decarboxylase
MGEVGAQSIMFSIDYPFESIPNGCVWWDDHVSINQHDLVNIGRNNALKILPRLMEPPHNLNIMTPTECDVGGLKKGSVTYGMYNEDWSRRLAKK